MGEQKTDTTKVPADSLERLIPSEYKVLKKIGKGGMGEVFQVLNKNLQRTEALKILRIKKDKVEEVKKRFAREAQMVAEIKRHNSHIHVPEIFFSHHQDDFFFFTMEYIEGTSLEKLIANKELEEQTTAQIVCDLANILEKIHKKEVIHRDIKPSNVLIDENGSPWLIDFGLVKQMKGKSTRLTETGCIVGTPKYMSPEQVKGKRNITTQSDIYSLGALFYEMLTFKPVVEGREIEQVLYQICHDDPKPPSMIADIDPRLEEICLKALHKIPHLRYQNAKKLHKALNKYLISLKNNYVFFAPLLRLWLRFSKSSAAKAIIILLLVSAITLISIFALTSFFDKPVQVTYGKKEQKLASQKYPIHLSDKSSIKFASVQNQYVYIFQREDSGKLLPLRSYWLKPEDKGRNTLVDLKDIKKDVQWIFFTSSTPIDPEQMPQIKEKLKNVYQHLQQKKRPKIFERLKKMYKKMKSRSLNPKIYQQALINWKIVNINSKFKPKLLGNIKVLHTPFIIETFLQNRKNKEFQPFSPETQFIKQNNKLQLKVNTYQQINMAFFLCSQRGVKQIYPQGPKTKLLVKDQRIIIPSLQGITLKGNKGQEYLCCFYSRKALNTEGLLNWLQSKNLLHYNITSQGKGSVVVLPSFFEKNMPPANIYIIALSYK